MLPTLLVISSENKDFADEYGVFEIGRVADGIRADGTANERKHLGIVLYSKTADEKSLYLKAVEMATCIAREIKQKSPSFAKAQSVKAWQHPKNTAVISLDGVEFGTVCALHPVNRVKFDKTGSVVAVEFDMNTFNAISASSIEFSEKSSMQSIYYDLSLLLPGEIRFSELKKCWQSENIAELESVRVIDTFERLGIKSITVRFNFVAMDRTLEMEEVQKFIDAILSNLSDIGVALRA